jgi:hypothetical protein
MVGRGSPKELMLSRKHERYLKVHFTFKPQADVMMVTRSRGFHATHHKRPLLPPSPAR